MFDTSLHEAERQKSKNMTQHTDGGKRQKAEGNVGTMSCQATQISRSTVVGFSQHPEPHNQTRHRDPLYTFPNTTHGVPVFTFC